MGVTECPFCSGATQDISSPLPAIAGYQLVRFLGAGGMGSVYLADDVTLGRRVAIKVISEKIEAASETRARFLREARAMASVEHPHIVRVYGFGETEGKAYLVMEYVEGETLAERIQRTGRLPVEEALSVVRQVVDALEAAWENHVVHRDIKPSNILLDRRNRVRVGDFGLAKPLHTAGDATLSQQGYILGTPHYISPEQARGQPVDFRSDIYSLGIVLYEMLAGERPFAGTTPLDVVVKHMNEPLPPLGEKRPDVPREVRRLLEAMTQKDAGTRPASYDEILASVDSLLGVTPGSRVPAPGRAPTPWKFSRLKIAAAVAVTALIVGAGFFAWRTLRTPEAPSVAEQKRLVVAVTPFYGPDEDSAKEGRVMAALVEKEITNRLGKENAKVLGIEDTKQPVHDHDAARALGQRLGASVVIWGEAFALRGETEIQPYFTMVGAKRPPNETPGQTGMEMMAGGQDPLAALQERAAKAVLVEAAAPNQIELRKTSAAGVGDVVLFLTGTHALYTEKNPEKALALFAKAPKTAESLRYRAQALVELNKKDQAIAALHEAVGLDPGDAQSYAQLGDLHMEAGEFKDAVAAYRAASEAGGAYTARQAIFYDGKLYKKDRFRSKRYSKGAWQETPYFLALDPQTGKVLERFRLPGLARSFMVKDNAVEIRYAVWSRDNPDDATITFSQGKFDRPIFYGGGLLLRRLGMTSAWTVAANFMANVEGREHPLDAKFVPSAKAIYDDAPRTFQELEGALRDSIAKDSTQPWYPFLLGEAFWSEGRRDDATKAWEQIFSGRFPSTPYYEFCWMALYFERLGQPGWADKAYHEALARRRQLPQPIEFNALIERLINTPFIAQAAAASQKGMDPERAYLWLLRVREISGICPEGDDFAARAWAKYFEEHGESVRAQREADYFQVVQRHPWSLAAIHARLDYALYACVAAMLGSLMLVFMVLAKAVRQRNPSVPDWYGQAVGLSGWKYGGFVTVLTGLTLWLAVSMAANPNPSKLVCCLSSFILFLSMLLRARMAPLLRVIAAIPRQARAMVAVAFLAVLLGAVLVVPATHSWVKVASATIGMMDSLGSAQFVEQLGSARYLEQEESRWKGNEAKPVRYVVASINYLAGNTERARQLYESLPQDGRAQKNLAALQRGELVPPEPPTAQDLYEALTVPQWHHWLELLPKPGYVFTFRDADLPAWLAGISFLFVALFLANVWLLGAFGLAPYQGGRELPPPKRPGERWIAKLCFFLVPGAYDLRHGTAWRGYVASTLGAFAALVGFSQLYLGLKVPAPGIISGSLTANYIRSFPYPTPASLPDEKAVAAYHYWTIFWAYPHAKVFWTVVGLAALISLGLHLARFRRIRNLYG